MKVLLLIHASGYNIGTFKLFLESGAVLQLKPAPFKQIPTTSMVAKYGGPYEDMKTYLVAVMNSQKYQERYILKEIEL